MVEFWIAREDGTFTKAEGDPLSIPEMPDLEFIIHVYMDELRVSEKSGGLRVSRGKTVGKAISEARLKLSEATPEQKRLMRLEASTTAKRKEDWLFNEAVKEAEKIGAAS